MKVTGFVISIFIVLSSSFIMSVVACGTYTPPSPTPIPPVFDYRNPDAYFATLEAQGNLPPPTPAIKPIYRSGSSSSQKEKYLNPYGRNQTATAQVKRCLTPWAHRTNLAKADAEYRRKDVSIGQLSVFWPAEATARAELVRKSNVPGC